MFFHPLEAATKRLALSSETDSWNQQCCSLTKQYSADQYSTQDTEPGFKQPPDSLRRLLLIDKSLSHSHKYHVLYLLLHKIGLSLNVASSNVHTRVYQ